MKLSERMVFEMRNRWESADSYRRLLTGIRIHFALDMDRSFGAMARRAESVTYAR